MEDVYCDSTPCQLEAAAWRKTKSSDMMIGEMDGYEIQVPKFTNDSLSLRLIERRSINPP